MWRQFLQTCLNWRLSRAARPATSRGRCRRTKFLSHGPLAACERLESRQLLDATGIQAFHRAGQTFLTWNEALNVGGEHYHVYRHNSPITTSNLAQAQQLTARWGPLDEDTSQHRLTGSGAPDTFVIRDLGAPLSRDQGLFVYTIPAAAGGSWYYAVTQITNGVERRVITAGASATTTPVVETPASPAPILVQSSLNGRGRVYTQFMDYADWNPTFQGYAYNYSLVLPPGYSDRNSWPLKLTLHAYGERYQAVDSGNFDWPAIEVFADDPGGTFGNHPTWWYGFAADHRYSAAAPIPTSGVIRNFTEQRLLRTIDEVMSRFSVDETRIHAQGNSMGASGALSLGIRYGDVFSAIYASQPMTNYGTSPGFQDNFQALWGTRQRNLPVASRGPDSALLQAYDGTGVYQWMNHHEQVIRRRGEDTAYLMFAHGTADTTIDWQTQGQPFLQALSTAKVAFSAETRAGWDHNWLGFSGVSHDLFTNGPNQDLGDFAYRNTVSFVAVANASDSGPVPPATDQTGYYNLSVSWATPWNQFHDPIVDLADRYEITLQSTTVAQSADITPRNLQQLQVSPGDVFDWQNVDNLTGRVVAVGSITATADGLLTVPGVQIQTGVGNRLILTRGVSRPIVTAPTAAEQQPRPTITWSAVPEATSYRVWVSDLSRSISPVIDTVVTDTSFRPANDLSLGRYTVWVRANLSTGQAGPWSQPQTFQIQPQPLILNTITEFEAAAPVISFSSVAGTTRYQVWVNDLSNGVSPLINDSSLTTNSVSLPALNLGRYRLWVRALNDVGDYGSWSPAFDFRIVTRPVLNSPASGGFASPTQFDWNSVAGAASYHVFLRSLETQATVLSQTGISGTTLPLSTSLPAGDYRWWVKAFSSDGTSGFWSLPQDFSVAGRPVLLSPSGLTGTATPTFGWQSFSDAARYILYVSAVDGSGVVIYEQSLTGTSFEAVSPLTAGSYRWWIRAVHASGQQSFWSRALDFTVS